MCKHIFKRSISLITEFFNVPIELKSKKTCVWKSITEEMELSPFPEAELLGLCCIVEELGVDLPWL